MLLSFAPLFELFAARRIAVRDLQPGDEIIFDDGGTRLVISVKQRDEIAAFRGRMARGVVIYFADGGSMPAHPGEPVRISKKR